MNETTCDERFVAMVCRGEIGNLSLLDTGKPIFFDAFIEDEHGLLPLLVYRDRLAQPISKVIHLSKIAEFARMWREERNDDE